MNAATAPTRAPAEARADRPDLRLAGLAVATWLSSLVVLYLGATGGALLGGLAGAGALAFGWSLRRGRGRSHLPAIWGWAIIGALLGMVCGAAATAARVVVRDSPPIAQLVERRTPVRAELVLRDDPRVARGGSGGPPTYLVTADVRRLTWPGGDLTVGARLLVIAGDPAWLGLLPGQPVSASGRLVPARGGDLRAAVLAADGAPQVLAAPPWYQRAAGDLREGLQRAAAPLPDEPGGLLPGLVVGDTSRLPAAVEEDFRATGLTHLTAVSGANCAIVVGALLLMARWSRAGPRLAAALSVAGLVGFVILARPSPSVLRAAVMGALALIALFSARHRAAVPGLCAAVTVLVVVDPELAGDAGFALSVLATGGLLLIAPRWRDALRRVRVPTGLAEALAVPAAAQLVCAPVIAGLSGTVSLAAIPANLVVAPAVAPATVLGVLAALLSPLWTGGAAAVAWLAQWPAWWLVLVARAGAQTPSGVLPWLAGPLGGLTLAALLIALVYAGRHRVVRLLAAAGGAAVLLAAVPVPFVGTGWPPRGWLVVACAVGQGDAVVLPVAAGRAVVVDAGPDPSGVDRCLRRLGVTAVPLLVLSHFHADHVGGIEGVFRGRRVGAVLAPSWPEPATGRALVQQVAADHGLRVVEPPAATSYIVGPARLTVLGPPVRITGTRSDANNNSLVVRVGLRGVTMLLAGDAEGEEQAAVLGRYGPGELRADVLKLAHHGSLYQDPAFLDAVAPRVALVSVGTGNSYGHPNPAVLARLGRSGARVLRTDLDGDLAALLTDAGLAVAVRPTEPGRHPP